MLTSVNATDKAGGTTHGIGAIAGRPSFLRTMEKVSCELRAATVSDEPFLWEMLYLPCLCLRVNRRNHGLYCVTRQLPAMSRVGECDAAIQV